MKDIGLPPVLALQPRAYSYTRMSTSGQQRGDSRRRQLELSANFAKKHNLVLATEDQLEDIGFSAFTGEHLAAGALGKFLEGARAGRVPSGSYLLVESLDRLSRQKIEKSLSLFLELINLGVVIVTLSDERIFRAGNLDILSLFASLLIMGRAHDESDMKSKRVASSWTGKRLKAPAEKLTARTRSWLELLPDRQTFRVREDRKAIVNQIFQNCVDGLGAYSIARRLNETGIQPFGRASYWQTSSIAKILTDPAVIGHFQAHSGRKPVGPLMTDYFPKIVEDNLFHQAQESRRRRKSKSSGRKGHGRTNLFSGLIKCGGCGASMHLVNKGAGPKGGTYLVCNAAQQGKCSKTRRWRYPHFEELFFALVEEISLGRILGGANGTAYTALEGSIRSLEGELGTVTEQQQRLVQLYQVEGGRAQIVGEKLNKLQGQHDVLEAKLLAKKEELSKLAAETRQFNTGKDEIKNLIGQLASSKSDDLFIIRSKIASHITAIVTAIYISADGEIDGLEAAIDANPSLPDQQLLVGLHRLDRHPGPYFHVSFKDGTFRRVFPSVSDPMAINMLAQMLDEQTFAFVKDYAAGQWVTGTDPMTRVGSVLT